MKLSQRVAPAPLIRICFVDYDREIALGAEHQPPARTYCCRLPQ